MFGCTKLSELPLSISPSASIPFIWIFVVAFDNDEIEADVTDAKVGRYAEAVVTLVDACDDRQTFA